MRHRAGPRLLRLLLAASAVALSACGAATSTTLAPAPSATAPPASAAATTVTRTVTATASSAATPPPTVVATPTATPPTAAQLEAVARRVFTADAGGGFGECDRGDDLSACPVTPRLSARLLQHPTSGPGGGAAPFCRCQNTSQDLTITVDISADRSTTHVALFGGRDLLDLVIIRSGGQLLVDDTTCTGKDPVATSLYAAQVPACAG